MGWRRILSLETVGYEVFSRFGGLTSPEPCLSFQRRKPQQRENDMCYCRKRISCRELWRPCRNLFSVPSVTPLVLSECWSTSKLRRKRTRSCARQEHCLRTAVRVDTYSLFAETMRKPMMCADAKGRERWYRSLRGSEVVSLAYLNPGIPSGAKFGTRLKQRRSGGSACAFSFASV